VGPAAQWCERACLAGHPDVERLAGRDRDRGDGSFERAWRVSAAVQPAHLDAPRMGELDLLRRVGDLDERPARGGLRQLLEPAGDGGQCGQVAARAEPVRARRRCRSSRSACPAPWPALRRRRTLGGQGQPALPRRRGNRGEFPRRAAPAPMRRAWCPIRCRAPRVRPRRGPDAPWAGRGARSRRVLRRCLPPGGPRPASPAPAVRRADPCPRLLSCPMGYPGRAQCEPVAIG
jgi:hypothetical protein